jgi:hypothetical protein
MGNLPVLSEFSSEKDSVNLMVPPCYKRKKNPWGFYHLISLHMKEILLVRPDDNP